MYPPQGPPFRYIVPFTAGQNIIPLASEYPVVTVASIHPVVSTGRPAIQHVVTIPAFQDIVLPVSRQCIVDVRFQQDAQCQSAYPPRHRRI